jgi:hypothetical protein
MTEFCSKRGEINNFEQFIIVYNFSSAKTVRAEKVCQLHFFCFWITFHIDRMPLLGPASFLSADEAKTPIQDYLRFLTLSSMPQYTCMKLCFHGCSIHHKNPNSNSDLQLSCSLYIKRKCPHFVLS